MAGEILAQLPEDLRSNEAFTGMNTAGDLAKGYLDVKGKVSEFEGKVKDYEGKVIPDLNKRLENSIPKLSENATDADKAAYYKAIGRPDKAEDYELLGPDGKPMDSKISQWARNLFFENGISKEVGKKIGDAWNAYLGNVVKAEVELREKEKGEAETKLKAELGDKYDASVELVKRVWKKFSNDEFDKFVNETKIGNHPSLIRFMINVAKLTGEDKSPPGSPRPGAGEKGGIVYDKSPEPPKK
jgi:hypothetical protein